MLPRSTGLDVPGRVTLLERALDCGGDRFDADSVEQAVLTLARTGERMRLGAEHSVVALVGATGSGKSSLFNALAGIELAEVGVRRPTTSKPTACVWGPEGADALLDWLRVPSRHRTARESVLDADREAVLHGLVLLDLPDHDSAEVTHRREVDRLVGMVDLLVWVVDPQKYADEAWHTGYLRRLAEHDGVMVVVLNQIDRLAPDEAETCRRDLRRLLDADGLAAVRLIAASAVRGDGVEDLLAVLADAVQGHAAVAERAAGDLDAAARDLSRGLGDSEPDPRALPGAQDLLSALAQAAGLPVVLDTVTAGYRRKAQARVGWPFARWVSRLRSDPVHRLRLGSAENELRAARAWIPAATPAQRERVDLAVHAITEAAAAALPARWADAVRAAAAPPGEDLTRALDISVAEVDLTLQPPVWWILVWLVEIALAGISAFGLAWLAVVGVAGWFGASGSSPSVGSLPLPAFLLIAGLVAGGVLARLARWAVEAGARVRRVRIAAELRDAVARVAWADVVSPVSEVLADHRDARRSLATMLTTDLVPVG